MSTHGRRVLPLTAKIFMTSASSTAIFIDSNVLIHASVSKSPLFSAAQKAIADQQEAGVELWISRQVLREYLSHLSRPQTFTTPIPIKVLTDEVRILEKAYRIAEDGPDIMRKLLDLLEQVPIGGKQIHDANIVATMQVQGISQILTDNISHFNRFSHLITVLPLQR